jgi:hypothetical protein
MTERSHSSRGTGGQAIASLIIFLVSLSPVGASAQDSQSAADVARELSNPVGSLASLVFQGNYAGYGGALEGASDQNTSSLVFLPTLPFKLGSGNFIVRPSFPVAAAPVVNTEGAWETERGFGDIVVLTNWGRAEKSGLLWGLGVTSVLPTASNDFVGQGQWQVGPSGLVGLLKPWGVVGALWQHWWGLNSREGEARINKGTLQLFYWVSLPGAWQIGGSPNATANYVAATDTDFSFPLNLGIARTFMIGKTAIKATVQGIYFVTRPDLLGPSWGLFFQITPVIRVPW